MRTLEFYLSTAHSLLASNAASHGFQTLMETQFFAGDVSGARNTAQRISDPETRMYAWTNIVSDCLERNDVATILALLKGETLLNGHLEFLSYWLESPDVTTKELRALLMRTAPDAVEMRAALWSAIARRGAVQEAVDFFETSDLPLYLQGSWQADLAIGLAKEKDFTAASKQLSCCNSLHRARALVALGRQGIDQGFIDTEVDQAFAAARSDANPDILKNTLAELFKVVGQWPRLTLHLDLLPAPNREISKFYAVWQAEGDVAGWEILCQMPELDTNNPIVAAVHNGCTFFASQAIVAYGDADTRNTIIGALLMNCLKDGDLDTAFALVQQITKVDNPAQSMQPYYRDSNREHVMEALSKAGRLDDMIALHAAFEQPMRRLTWASKVALALIKADKMALAQNWADQFQRGFDALSPSDDNRTYLLAHKAALYMAVGEFDRASRLSAQADEWSRDQLPADAVLIAADRCRHHDQMCRTIDAVWENSAKDDPDLLISVIAACYKLQTAIAT